MPISKSSSAKVVSSAPLGPRRFAWYDDLVTESWRKSFVAASVAMGIGVDEALAALECDDATTTLARALRAQSRATRANALASAVHEIVLAIDEARLR
jgi:hypothetical protein